VISIARKNLNALAELNEMNKANQPNDKPINNSDTIKMVREIIEGNNDMTPQEKSNAKLVLEKLNDNKATSFGQSEQDVLTTVLNKISQLGEEDKELKANLKETLGKQMASGVENGSVVCSTGKILRILGTLDGIDSPDGLEQIRPLWALKEEIGTLASNIRDKHISALNEEEKAAYDRGELIALEESMRREYTKSAEDIYLTDLKMSKAIVQPIIQMYEEAF
jgi:hypothetical protein